MEEWLPEQPGLKTARLELRALVLDDAPALHRLANAPEVAATTLLIPHPYPPGAAEAFIVGQEGAFMEGRGITYGIFEQESGELTGCTGIGIDRRDNRAEMGYWIGVPYWRRGYATEAALRLLAFAFAWYRLPRVEAACFASNPASARVLEKIGMERCGFRPNGVYKEGRGWEDVVDYEMLIADWNRSAGRAPSTGSGK